MMTRRFQNTPNDRHPLHDEDGQLSRQTRILEWIVFALAILTLAGLAMTMPKAVLNIAAELMEITDE